jgi:putative copper resistance protein D
MIGFLDVVLRGLALAAQAVALGGVAFLLVAVGGETGRVAAWARARSAALAGGAALALAAVQALLLALHVSALAGDGTWPVGLAMTTGFFQAGAARALAALGLAAAVRRLGRGGRGGSRAACVALGLTVTGAAAWMSHAAGRLEHRAVLLGLDAAHQAAAAVWLGGLAHLAATAVRPAAPWPAGILRRFSATALAAVAALVLAGAGMSWLYVDGPAGLVGTAYGLMVMTKVVMLGALLALGGANFLAVRGLRTRESAPPPRVRWFVEVELGLGLVAILVAASLTSLPPAADVVADRATAAEVGQRFVPGWPRLASPAFSDLPAGDPEAPRTAADRAWSEYNHNVAGLFVLAMGALASLHALWGARWARHWPLVFLPLAAFMLVRSDPGSWPLGPIGFWEGWTYPSVLQHRVFVLVAVGFGVFEWMVRTERLRPRPWAFVFPALAVLGGGLLLTHGHALGELKAEFLTEVTHAPLGLLALAVGWGRWLELRMGPPGDRVPRHVWAGALLLVGALLLIYHERW